SLASGRGVLHDARMVEGARQVQGAAESLFRGRSQQRGREDAFSHEGDDGDIELRSVGGRSDAARFVELSREDGAAELHPGLAASLSLPRGTGGNAKCTCDS